MQFSFENSSTLQAWALPGLEVFFYFQAQNLGWDMAHFDGGYFRVYRKMFRSKSGFYGDGEAIAVFMCLLDRANWKDSDQPLRKQRVTLKRGQLATSLHVLHEQTGFARNTVSRALKRMVEWNVIETSAGHNGTIVTIKNYDRYQSSDHDAETQDEQEPNTDGDAGEAADGDAGEAHPKKEKKEKKENSAPGKDRSPKDRVITWTEDDPYARCFENLRSFSAYWKIFDREHERRALDSHKKAYDLSTGDLEKVTYELRHWADGPKAEKVKSPRGTLATFVRTYVERKGKAEPQKKAVSLFETYGINPEGHP